jgi:hypothetical protein
MKKEIMKKEIKKKVFSKSKKKFLFLKIIYF